MFSIPKSYAIEDDWSQITFPGYAVILGRETALG